MSKQVLRKRQEALSLLQLQPLHAQFYQITRAPKNIINKWLCQGCKANEMHNLEATNWSYPPASGAAAATEATMGGQGMKGAILSNK